MFCCTRVCAVRMHSNNIISANVLNLVRRAHMPLVSTKTRSSGIINFQRPGFLDFRFHSSCEAWFTWRLEIQLMWIRSTKAFNMHWKNLESRNILALREQQYQILKAKDTRALGTSLLTDLCLGADQKARGLWEISFINGQIKVL